MKHPIVLWLYDFMVNFFGGLWNSPKNMMILFIFNL